MNFTASNDKARYDNWLTRLIILSLIVSLWLGCWYLLLNNQYLKDYSERGQFGDMFGVINSLFSGLAFGGIIYTILLQREELKAQREELKLTKQEFITQNETLRLQRFENTFFKLIDVHNNIVNLLKCSVVTQGGRFEREGRVIFNDVISCLRQEKGLHGNPNKYNKDDFNSQTALYKNAISQITSLSGLDFYFQSLLSILELVSTTTLLTEKGDTDKESENRRYYFKLFLSTQSGSEQTMIYYHIAYGWQISQFNDYLFKLREIEKKHSVYRYSNVSYLTQDHNYHMFLIDKFFELFYRDDAGH